MRWTNRRPVPVHRFLAATLVVAAATAAPPHGPVPAEARQAGATHVATVEGISEYRLENGLRVVLFPDASRPSTTVNVTYLVGSRHESYGETGMAHLLEHLLFKGTPTHPDIPQELTERGGRANGTTWFDRTNYFITFPASDETLEWALRLEADRMVNSFVRKEDLDSEMTVVRNELEARDNNPLLVTIERALSAAYRWHAYGRSVIGARSDLENVPIERLQAFYRKYYQPDNALLVVSGRFDEARVLEWTERYFGAIPRPTRTGDMVIWDTYTREPAQDGERTATVRRVGEVQYALVSYHVPAAAHEDIAAVDILTHVLGNQPSGRLYRALVEPGLASRVGAIDFYYQTREPGVLLAFAEVRLEQSLDEVRSILTRTIDGLVENPPTEEEVERARAALLRNWQLTMNNSERVGINLTEWAAVGDWRLMFIHRDRLRAVRLEDVARAAEAYLPPSNRTVALFVPDREPRRAQIPDNPDIDALVADYRGSDVIAAGEEFEPTHGNIEERTRRLELDNGFRVGLLPKQTRGGTVLVRFTQRFGNEAELWGRSTAASLAGGMLMRGTRHRTRHQIIDELARLQAQMGVGGGTTSVSGSIETTRENLPAVLDLLREVLREPAFDEREFELLKAERLATLESQKTEPNALGSIEYQRHMNPREPGHPLYVQTFDEAIEAVRSVTLEEAREFYREFHGAGDGGHLTVLGDFDAEEVEAFARQAFGDWPRARAYERVANPYREVEPARIVIETPDKANAFFMAGHGFPMRDDHEDYPALTLGAFMLGGGFLNSRLAVRIRQQEGISYGIGATISADAVEERGAFTTFAIYAPQNADRLVAAYFEEIEKAVADGFTAEEVEAAKRGWMQQRDVARATDGQLVGTIHNHLYLDRTLFDAAEFEARVRALTPDRIRDALRRHIDPERISIVRAGDFASVAAATDAP